MTDTNISHAVSVQFAGKTVRAIPQGGGLYLQIGNTNGNPVDAYTWLTWAILNGTAKADPTWGASGQLHSWYSNQHYGASFLNHWLPIAIEATTVAAVSYGFVAAAGAGAAGGAAAGGAAPTATFTGTLAAPVTAVDTGLTVSTIAPVTFGGAVAVGGATGIGGAAAAAAGKIIGNGGGALNKLAQLAGALTGAKLANNSAPTPPAGTPSPATPAKTGSLLALIAGAVALVAVMAYA